jgi:hypothetical protein
MQVIDLRRFQRLLRKGKDGKMSSFILPSFPLRGFCLFVIFVCLKFFAELFYKKATVSPLLNCVR